MNEETSHCLKKGAIILAFAFLGGLFGSMIGNCRCHCMHHTHFHHSQMMPFGNFFDQQKAFEHKMKKIMDNFEKRTSDFKGEVIEEDYVIIPRRFLNGEKKKEVKPFDGPKPENKR